jgi:glycosyltransferase involved in cell wall biosynthesis
MPAVSVIIPTYNRVAMVREAIESVLAQSYADRELIVVDDGSTDETEAAIASLIPQLTYVYQEHRGVSAARNRGASLARGKYLAFLDSDDLWLKDKLQRQMRFMESHPEARICYTDEIWIRRGVRVNPMKKHRKYSGMIFPHCLPLCIISPSSALFARGLFEEAGMFDEALAVCEDYDLWLRIAARQPIYLVDEPLIVKRGGHADQLSRSRTGQDRYRIAAIEKLLRGGQLTAGQRALTVKELVRKCSIYGNGCMKRGRREEGESVLRIAARYSAAEAARGLTA